VKYLVWCERPNPNYLHSLVYVYSVQLWGLISCEQYYAVQICTKLHDFAHKISKNFRGGG